MVLNYTPRAAQPTLAEYKANMSIRDPIKAGRVTSLVMPAALAGGLTSKAGQAVSGAKNIFQRVTRYNPLAGTTLKGFAKGALGKTLGFLTFTETLKGGYSLATGNKYNPIPSKQTLATAGLASINPYGTYAGYLSGVGKNIFETGKNLFTPATGGGIPWVNMTPANAKALPSVPQSAFYPQYPDNLSPTIVMPSAAAPNISYTAPSLSVSGGGGGIDPAMIALLLGGALGGGYLLGKRRRKKKKYKKRRSR